MEPEPSRRITETYTISMPQSAPRLEALEQPDSREPALKMLSEWLREAGVLVMVFGLLDYYLIGLTARPGDPPPGDDWWVTKVVVIGSLLTVVGMLIGRKRKT